LLILALEAEIRSSLPHLSELAAALGARFGAGKGVVMARYRLVCDILQEWIGEVPWLERSTSKRPQGKARADTPKRLAIARGLKDVLQFQEEIWKKKLETLKRPRLILEEGIADEVGNEAHSTRLDL